MNDTSILHNIVVIYKEQNGRSVSPLNSANILYVTPINGIEIRIKEAKSTEQ
jgi:hypothetical protein